jgi:hypothetical protein
MKKSKIISLVLVSAALASCHKNTPEDGDWNDSKKVYIRSDTSAAYSHHHGGAWLWYYAFRPYGFYRGGAYNRAGYYSNSIHHNANIGKNFSKANITRGGFGRSGFSSARS